MAINTLEFAEKLTGELDRMIVQKAVTGFMADNVMQARFVGARTVLIPDLDMAGLGDYDRDAGFVQGAVKVSNTSYTTVSYTHLDVYKRQTISCTCSTVGGSSREREDRRWTTSSASWREV